MIREWSGIESKKSKVQSKSLEPSFFDTLFFAFFPISSRNENLSFLLLKHIYSKLNV